MRNKQASIIHISVHLPFIPLPPLPLQTPPPGTCLGFIRMDPGLCLREARACAYLKAARSVRSTRVSRALQSIQDSIGPSLFSFLQSLYKSGYIYWRYLKVTGVCLRVCQCVYFMVARCVWCIRVYRIFQYIDPSLVSHLHPFRITRCVEGLHLKVQSCVCMRVCVCL